MELALLAQALAKLIERLTMPGSVASGEAGEGRCLPRPPIEASAL